MAIHRWVGRTSTDITVSSNWSANTLPQASDTIIFDELAEAGCIGTLSPILSLMVVKPEYLFGLGVGSSSADILNINTAIADIRSAGTNYMTLASSTKLTLHGAGDHYLIGSDLSSITLLGSLNDFNSPAFSGTLQINNTTALSDNLEITGNCSGHVYIDPNIDNELKAVKVDGRGITVTLQRGASSVQIEGAPTGFVNTINLSPTMATTYPLINVQGETSKDTLINVTEGVTINSLYMDGGFIDFSQNASSAGASISSAQLYGAAVVDVRNALQNITLSDIKVFSQDVSIKVDNGTTMNISY